MDLPNAFVPPVIVCASHLLRFCELQISLGHNVLMMSVG